MDFDVALVWMLNGKTVRRKSKPDDIFYIDNISNFDGTPSKVFFKRSGNDIYGAYKFHSEAMGDDWEEVKVRSHDYGSRFIMNKEVSFEEKYKRALLLIEQHKKWLISQIDIYACQENMLAKRGFYVKTKV